MMRIVYKKLATGLLATLLISQAASGSRKSEYEVSGRLTYTSYKVDGSVEGKMKRLFTISVSNCLWIIHTTDASQQGPLEKRRGPLYWESGTDGTNRFSIWVANTNYVGEYYQVRVRPDGTDERVLREGAFTGANVAGGTIMSGPIPTEDKTFGDAVWLAFASSCYLDTRKNSLRALWTLDDAVPSYGKDRKEEKDADLRAEWRRRSAAPFLPTTIIYFDDILRRRTENGFVITKAPVPWTVAQFESFAFTNVSGLDIPTAFSMTRFSSPQRTPADRRIVTRVDGNVDRISRKLSVGSFKPILPGSTLITDHRFDPILNGRKAVTVMLEAWKNDEDLEQLDEYAALGAKVSFPTTLTTKSSRFSGLQVLTYGALLVFTIGFGAAAARKLRFRRSEIQKNNK